MGFSLSIVPQSLLSILEAYGRVNMRIIGGKAKGQRLKFPKNKNVRPTADRVKEGLFNVLQNKIEGSIFLDGYAGSGSIGIEALSRGAAHVVFVEKHRSTIKFQQYNLSRTGLGEAATVICQDLHKAAKTIREDLKFDLIFLDPPYHYSLEQIWPPPLIRLLAAEGVVIIEHSGSKSMGMPSEGLKIMKSKSYGSTELLFYQREANE